MTPKSIVDQRLPDGDGFDVLRAAREAGIPVIMVTGYGSPGSGPPDEFAYITAYPASPAARRASGGAAD
jgi:CheY-like chemotaxis protein